MTAPFTVGIIQDDASDDTAATVAASIERVREAADRGAQIVCLKELFNAPYFCKSQRCERFDLAETIPGPTTDRMQMVAQELGIVLIVPLFERQARGVYRNSAAIIDADGSLLGVYRKMHIPDDPLFNEKYYFTPGDAATDDRIDAIGQVAKQASGFRVWKTRFANVGVLICWDQWFPEAARAMALAGAEVLLYPTAIGSEPPPALPVNSREHWQRTQQGHAAANLIPLVAANRYGLERSLQDPDGLYIRFYGSSFITDALGAKVAEAAEEGDAVLTASFDLEQAAASRDNWFVFRDRRPDLYGALTSLDGIGSQNRMERS